MVEIKKGMSALKKKSKLYTLEELSNNMTSKDQRHILVEPESGKSLKDELQGLKSYRTSKFSIRLPFSNNFPY